MHVTAGNKLHQQVLVRLYIHVHVHTHHALRSSIILHFNTYRGSSPLFNLPIKFMRYKCQTFFVCSLFLSCLLPISWLASFHFTWNVIQIQGRKPIYTHLTDMICTYVPTYLCTLCITDATTTLMWSILEIDLYVYEVGAKTNCLMNVIVTTLDAHTFFYCNHTHTHTRPETQSQLLSIILSRFTRAFKMYYCLWE